MDNKRLILVGVLAAFFVAGIAFLIPGFRNRVEWKRTAAALQSLPHERIDAAVQAFKRARRPAEGAVPLRELVAGGYLRAADVRELADKDVLVSLAVDRTFPQTVWIRVRVSDGSDVVLLADGSVLKAARQ